MLEQDLVTVGLTKTEAAIYVWLLDSGTASPKDISSATGINRTTVYSATKELSKKGLISIMTNTAGTSFTPQSPHVLESIIQKEAAQVKEKKKATQRVIEQLQAEDDYEYAARHQFESLELAVSHISEKFDSLVKIDSLASLKGWAYADKRTTIPFLEILQDLAFTHNIDVPIHILSFSKEINQHDVTVHQPPLHVRKWSGPELFPTNSIILGSTVIYLYRKAGKYHITYMTDMMVVGQLKSLWNVLWDSSQSDPRANFVL